VRRLAPDVDADEDPSSDPSQSTEAESRVIAGVDISTRAIHIASLPEDTNEAELHVVRLDTLRGSALDRVRRMRDLMPARGAWRDAGITLIAVERPYSHQAATLAPMMLAYGGLVQLLPADVPLLELSPPEWRRECLLPQRGADRKAAAIRFAREQWPTAPNALDDNAADAFCIAYAARQLDLRRAHVAA